MGDSYDVSNDTSISSDVGAINSYTWTYSSGFRYYFQNTSYFHHINDGLSYITYTTNNTTNNVNVVSPPLLELTPEQLEASRRAAEDNVREYNRLLAIDLEKIKIAAQKAEDLLKSILNNEQLKEFNEKTYFTTVGNKSGKKYRITKKDAHGVFRINDTLDRLIEEYCIVPNNSDIPTYDRMVMQKLLLENDEERFLEIANMKSVSLAA